MSAHSSSSSPKKRDFRTLVRRVGIFFLVLLILLASLLIIKEYVLGSWEADSDTIAVQHVVVSTEPQPLSHFVDRNASGTLQEAERKIKRVPNGCYSFTATGPDVMFDHIDQATALGDIVRLNGNDAGDWVFPVTDNQITVSFDPSFGRGNIAGGGYEVVNITLTPKACPSEEEQ